MCATTTSPTRSSGGGSSRSIAAGSVRQQTVRMEASRNCIGNGPKSGASHGNVKGPAADAASSRRRSGGGAPRQLSDTRVPHDGAPVEVEPEPWPIWHDGAAVANLELRREQLV